MYSISCGKYDIWTGQNSLDKLKELAEAYDKVFVLVDENTNLCCLPLIDIPCTGLVIVSGEASKTLSTCQSIWNMLMEEGASRRSLLVNLGGGVIGDMGSFCAALYMRGIDFVQVPTTLLAMVDASIGGKSGVDFNAYKNMIGLFTTPKMVLIDPAFLVTLDPLHIICGKAEMLKHGLIADADHAWQVAQSPDIPSPELILDSLTIKKRVVDSDPLEKGLRKILNFGHTTAHAIEAAALKRNTEFMHGFAVAAGMVCEAYLSVLKGMPEEHLEKVCNMVASVAGKPDISAFRPDELVSLMRHDKKNSGGRLLFTLLSGIGSATYDNEITEQQAEEAILFYLNDYRP